MLITFSVYTSYVMIGYVFVQLYLLHIIIVNDETATYQGT